MFQGRGFGRGGHGGRGFPLDVLAEVVDLLHVLAALLHLQQQVLQWNGIGSEEGGMEWKLKVESEA